MAFYHAHGGWGDKRRSGHPKQRQLIRKRFALPRENAISGVELDPVVEWITLEKASGFEKGEALAL